MAIDEKEALDELEKGQHHVAWNRPNSCSWKDVGLAVYLKIVLSLMFLAVIGHKACMIFCTAHPKITTIRIAGVPQFVLDYAPLVYLDIGEAYFPSDIPSQVTNTHPATHHSAIPDLPTVNISNLAILNRYGRKGRNVYLTSNMDVTTSPSWLNGIVPDSTNHTTKNAMTAAIIVTDHGDGMVDAFYMYFYAYNQGNTVLGHELGDHIGDWEHNMIRFEDGVPQAIWFSQHGNGEAFLYTITEKIGKRPISYSARGSHANYATAGKHDHTIPDLNLPNGLILDYTSRGTLWDPTQRSYFYNFHPESRTFEGLNGSPEAAMDFRGRWGDQQYPEDDERQPNKWFGFSKYVSGPTGPRDKQLDREEVCPRNGFRCILRDRLGP